MSEVKWIKITTNMFEDEKIDFIESLPESDGILIIWIKLLVLAGKCNNCGYISLTDRMPYTEEMLAHKFRKPINVIKLALSTLINLGMIEVDEQGYINIINWEKHQNIEGLERIREQNRIRKARQREREREKLMLLEGSHVTDGVTGHVTVTDGHATEQEQEEELEQEQDIDKEQEQERSCCSSSKDENIARISKEFEQLGFGTISYTVKEILVDYLDEYSPEWIIEAFKIAVKANRRSLNYVEGILKNFRVQGGMKVEPEKKPPQVKKFDRRTKFHPAVQRTDNYTAEELEAVARRKREEAIRRMKENKSV